MARARTTETGTEVDELTDAEIVELYRNFSLSAPIRIPTDKLSPDFEYRWINKAKPNTYQRRRGVGWMPVTTKDLEKLVRPPHTVDDLHLGSNVTPDGYVGIGDDLVFARINKRYAQAIRAHNARINADRLKAGRARFHDAGKLAGAATFEEF